MQTPYQKKFEPTYVDKSRGEFSLEYSKSLEVPVIGSFFMNEPLLPVQPPSVDSSFLPETDETKDFTPVSLGYKLGDMQIRQDFIGQDIVSKTDKMVEILENFTKNVEAKSGEQHNVITVHRQEFDKSTVNESCLHNQCLKPPQSTSHHNRDDIQNQEIDPLLFNVLDLTPVTQPIPRNVSQNEKYEEDRNSNKWIPLVQDDDSDIEFPTLSSMKEKLELSMDEFSNTPVVKAQESFHPDECEYLAAKSLELKKNQDINEGLLNDKFYSAKEQLMAPDPFFDCGLDQTTFSGNIDIESIWLNPLPIEDTLEPVVVIENMNFNMADYQVPPNFAPFLEPIIFIDNSNIEEIQAKCQNIMKKDKKEYKTPVSCENQRSSTLSKRKADYTQANDKSENSQHQKTKLGGKSENLTKTPFSSRLTKPSRTRELLEHGRLLSASRGKSNKSIVERDVFEFPPADRTPVRLPKVTYTRKLTKTPQNEKNHTQSFSPNANSSSFNQRKLESFF
ncbi:hypothetical protein G9A89_001842 [Geosiphon pyriformis]|nr:hypothetical protein G9A89_001842 [Geosiphon pyriformis]